MSGVLRVKALPCIGELRVAKNTFKIPTLIKAMEPTPNDNVYSRESLQLIIDDVHERMSYGGEIIPLTHPIDSKSVTDIHGHLAELILEEDGQLVAEVAIVDTEVRERYKPT